jgi:phage terminase Nu1 subunit (DNA packaging protein)
MVTSVVKELYNAPNGDRWSLCRDAAGKLVVSHQPNQASGGQTSETDVNLFLSFGGNGPEYQALTKALADVAQGPHAHERKGQIAAETMDSLSRALGQAVAQSWSSLPQEIQQRLFEAAVRSQGETIRQELAVYLHGKHDRTSDVGQSRAVPEPDSLGG